MRTIKFLTGTTFALLLGAVCMSPAMAQTGGSPDMAPQPIEDNPRTNQNPTQPLPGDENPSGFDQTTPGSTTGNDGSMQLQQNPGSGTTGGNRNIMLEQNTGQDTNNRQPMTGQSEQEQRNVQQRTVEERTTRQRTTITQPGTTNIDTQQPAADTQERTNTTAEETPPVRALW